MLLPVCTLLCFICLPDDTMFCCTAEINRTLWHRGMKGPNFSHICGLEQRQEFLSTWTGRCLWTKTQESSEKLVLRSREEETFVSHVNIVELGETHRISEYWGAFHSPWFSSRAHIGYLFGDTPLGPSCSTRGFTRSSTSPRSTSCTPICTPLSWQVQLISPRDRNICLTRKAGKGIEAYQECTESLFP